MHATNADVTFYDGPGMHGFVLGMLVKTWLLIACGTGFYAIITDSQVGDMYQ